MKNLKEYIFEYVSMDKNAKAFTIIKPGFLQYKDKIYDYIVKKGFIMYDHADDLEISLAMAHKIYKIHKDEDWYEDLCKYMSSGPIDAAQWGFDYDKHPGENAIYVMNDIKHHFRDKYGIDEMRNVMHSSDSLENVQKEGSVIFN